MIYNLGAVGRSFGTQASATVALKNLTLDILPGEHVALLGPSGSGKTTLLRLLNASIFPTSGRLLYSGADPSTMTQAELRRMRRRIGCVYQQHYLVPGMSALRNTLSGALGRWGIAATLRNLIQPSSIEVERAHHCLESVGLQDKMQARCDQLSGGQQQRLAIARTLMQQPEVLLADEPVASLDPVLSDEIVELLVRVAEEGHMVLLISLHDVGLARRHSNRVVGLREGEIAFDMPTCALSEDFLEQLYDRPRGFQPAGATPPVLLEVQGGFDGTDASRTRSCLR